MVCTGQLCCLEGSEKRLSPTRQPHVHIRPGPAKLQGREEHSANETISVCRIMCQHVRRNAQKFVHTVKSNYDSI
jgi:hypothetical protein